MTSLSSFELHRVMTEAISRAAGKLGRSRETVREAATFYVVQILLFPDADSYRVLGARPQATNGELRRNMTLLLRWLHPDLDPKGEAVSLRRKGDARLE